LPLNTLNYGSSTGYIFSKKIQKREYIKINNMNALRQVVLREQIPLLDIPLSMGNKFEIIIVPLNDEIIDTESFQMMKLQETNGSMAILNEPEEEVWNEL
jgi:hypothetical protein